MTPMQEAPSCARCAYWQVVRENTGLCRRRAPEAAHHAEEVAHWPQTHGGEGCGDGVEGPESRRVSCAACVFWRRYKGGMHPMNRADMPNSWWARAGVCSRHAPRPVNEPGPRAFWRATADIDFCGEAVGADLSGAG
jgi:hypothetical protein